LLTTTRRPSARYRLCSSVWVGHEPEHLLDGDVDLEGPGHRRRHPSSLRLPPALGRGRFHQPPPTTRYIGSPDPNERAWPNTRTHALLWAQGRRPPVVPPTDTRVDLGATRRTCRVTREFDPRCVQTPTPVAAIEPQTARVSRRNGAPGRQGGAGQRGRQLLADARGLPRLGDPGGAPEPDPGMPGSRSRGEGHLVGRLAVEPRGVAEDHAGLFGRRLASSLTAS